MENLFEGAIINISNIAEEPHIVLSTVEHDEKVYALITEVEGNVNLKKMQINRVSFDITKAVVISYNKKNGEVIYDSNKEIIKELIHKIKSYNQ